MTKDQKIAGAGIAALVLAMATVFALWLVWLGSGETPAFAVNPNDMENPELLAPWRAVKLIVEMGTGIQVALGGLIIIVTVATGWMTEVFSRRLQLYATVVACIIGIGAALWLLIDMGDTKIASLRFYGQIYNELPEAESLARTASGFRAFCFELIALFSFFLASRLGIKLADDEGKLRKLLKRLFGEGGEP